MYAQVYTSMPTGANLSALCGVSDNVKLDKHNRLVNCSALGAMGPNTTVNTTELPFQTFEALYGTWHVILTSLLLGLFILCTIIGNVFVVAAIILEKNLQVGGPCCAALNCCTLVLIS